MARNDIEVRNDAASEEATHHNDGLVKLDRYQMMRLRLAAELTAGDFIAKTRLNKRTVAKIFDGTPVQMGVAKKAKDFFGVPNLLDILDPEQYQRPRTSREETGGNSGLTEWIESGRPGRVETASNGLQYRVYQLRHRYEPDRIGRGKRYELFHLPDDEQERLREQLLRHFQVCNRVCGSPYFPACYATFPERDGNVWWVVERWVEGVTLQEVLANGAIDADRLPAVMTGLADALAVLHTADVVRRELSPASILLPDAGPAVLLTDFELAKLTDRGPTVSTKWPIDDYRAPEVVSGDIDVRADLYSWARILVHAVSGQLPPARADKQLLAKFQLPKPVAAIANKCLAPARSGRPASIAAVQKALRNWT